MINSTGLPRSARLATMPPRAPLREAGAGAGTSVVKVHGGRLTPAELVAGPRGRRLCFELVRQSADHLAGHQQPTLWWQLFMHEPGDLAEDLASAVTDTDLDALGGAQDPRSLLPALADAVEWARYWQEPDEITGGRRSA